MRIMKTTPAASLDPGKWQGIARSTRTVGDHSRSLTVRGEGRNKMIAFHQASLVWWHVISSAGAKS